MATHYLIGIDEAGRGPLAGPVSVGAVLLMPHFDYGQLRGMRDSKGLSANMREDWYAQIQHWKREGLLRFAVSYSSADVIDRRGIVFAVRSALARSITKLYAQPQHSRVLLDGGLKAPEEFQNQETIIGGDAREPVIALASIVAKVRRDRLMQRLAKRYPTYAFEIHKGYGTALHRAHIQEQGPCDIHRRSFLKNIAS